MENFITVSEVTAHIYVAPYYWEMVYNHCHIYGSDLMLKKKIIQGKIIEIFLLLFIRA